MSTRSNKKMSRGLNGEVIDHKRYIKTYRYQVMRVIRDIENGSVTEDDMARLRNFCQMSITLMEHAPISQIQAAWRDTEIMAFAHDAVDDGHDTGVVLRGPDQPARSGCIPESFRKE
ncbi:hypothetical protein H1O16_gp197 [Burkholderia phage BcepSaruman]|uniref:Uncharacterized protein n=1 Tax=Burkholderia phage BcepSaruman TaxID=2530032 RepID=A0A4D5ZD55_9CAUD|nr:hypothetical protein H1O16_gp197 [Burkholderia phage BcepSaruman]QBX06610.1 hypothetical protein BcepSaruman_197 [Burkholderia phage BcepSaruman]